MKLPLRQSKKISHILLTDIMNYDLKKHLAEKRSSWLRASKDLVIYRVFVEVANSFWKNCDD